MIAPGPQLWTHRRAEVIALPMNTGSERVAQREPERQYGLTLMQILTPFLILGSVLLVGVILTVH
jgi:hypothetical protein